MKYLQRYEQYNEGWKKNLAKAGLMGSLLLTSPESSSTDLTNNIEMVEKEDQLKEMEENIKTLSLKRKKVCQDQELNIILDEIQSNINSKDSTKFLELFNKLNNHLVTKYNYNLTPQEIPTKNDIMNNFNVISILGWLGSLLLAICGAPQAWQSYKDKHSDGISWAFLLLWGFGEIFCLGYVYDKFDLPLLMNYAVNILIVGVMIYYKINPKNDTQEV